MHFWERRAVPIVLFSPNCPNSYPISCFTFNTILPEHVISKNKKKQRFTSMIKLISEELNKISSMDSALNKLLLHGLILPYLLKMEVAMQVSLTVCDFFIIHNSAGLACSEAYIVMDHACEVIKTVVRETINNSTELLRKSQFRNKVHWIKIRTLQINPTDFRF